MTPGWILDIFAGLLIAATVVSAARLIVAGRPGHSPAAWSDHADIDAAHVLMGIAMAGMLAKGLRSLPDAVWEVTFAVLTAWFGWRVSAEFRRLGGAALTASHHAPHFVHSAAMLYMLLALTAPAAAASGMAGMAGSMGILSVPTLALAFALVLAGYTVWDLDQASGGRHGHTRPGALRVGLPGPAVLAAPGSASTEAVATATSSRGRSAVDPLLDPRVAVGCRIAMGVTMTLMLMLMI